MNARLIIRATRLLSELGHTDTVAALEELQALRGAALWALMHHQGGSSPVGQPLRKALGIAPYADLTPEQFATAKVAAGKWGPG